MAVLVTSKQVVLAPCVLVHEPNIAVGQFAANAEEADNKAKRTVNVFIVIPFGSTLPKGKMKV